MTVTVIADASPGEVRAAAIDDATDQAIDVAIWRPARPDGVGDLHLGRVVARAAAMAGSFVAIEGATGFLPDSDVPEGISEGDALPVRVVRAAQGGKGPRLSARLDLKLPEPPSRLAPALITRGPDPLRRLAALHPGSSIVTGDPGLAADLRAEFGTRVRSGGLPERDRLETLMEELSSPSIDLPGGGAIHIHPTPALVAIDVDLGAGSGERRKKADWQFQANRTAIASIARQIRLRNLGGAILVDFGGMQARRRGKLGPDLERALAADPLGPRLLGFTALGLAEIVRPRVAPMLHELLLGPYPSALAALRQAAREAQASPGARPVLHAATAVLAALRDDPESRADLARRTGRDLLLRTDPALRGSEWRIEFDHA